MNPVHRILRTALAAMTLSWAGPSALAAEPLARAGSVEISVEEIRSLIEALPAQDQTALTKDPALLSQFVRAQLTRKSLLAEVAAKKLDQQPSVKAQLERAREQLLIDLLLDSVSAPPAGFPSDAEVQAAYEANKAALEVPRQFRVAQVYVALPKGADKAAEETAKKKLDDLAKKLKAKGADFAAIARADSEDAQTAAKGGEIGWLTEAQMVPGIRATATALAKEAVSEPVRLDDGWHVLKLLDTRAAGPKPLAEVREALVAQLRAAKARELRQAHLAKLLEQNPPAINELALSKALPKAK
jgi:parvulin-like peptidyl-prolyl isomerase